MDSFATQVATGRRRFAVVIVVVLATVGLVLPVVPAGAAAPAGGLFASGNNFYGELGSATNNGTSNPNPTPTLVTLPGQIGPVTQIAAGSAHSLAGTSSGQLYAFGINFYGQLGSATNSGTSNPNPTPTPVTMPGQIGTVTQVAAGQFHSLAVTSSGQLYAFGYNYFGQQGTVTNNGTGTPNPTPTPVGLPGQVGPVTQIAAGAYHSLALTASGQLYAFGYNSDGQLGIDHLEGHDPGQLTDMTRREPSSSHGEDTCDDRISRQRSSQEEDVFGGPPLLPELRCLHGPDTPNRSP